MTQDTKTLETDKGVTLSLVRALAAELTSKHAPLQIAATLKAHAPFQSTKALRREIKALIGELEGHLGAGRRQEAMATAMAALFADADYAISKMRRDGVLRASKYGYDGLGIGNIARMALKIRPLLSAREERFDYLESVVALSKLAPSAAGLRDKVVKILQTRQNVALKTILAVVNSRFHHMTVPDVSHSSLRLARYTVEDISDAASLLIAMYRDLFPIHDHCCNLIDVDGIAGTGQIYERLLVAAIRLTKFRDAEVLIDGLPFQARVESGAVVVSSIDPDIERSIRLGYIHSQNQVLIRARHLSRSGPPPSLQEFINQGFERGVFEQLVELVEKPFRRFRLVLPTAPQVFKLFRRNEMFRDEIENLLMVDADTFGELDPAVEIAPQVTMMDMLKVQRYFNFISCLYQRKLETIGDGNERAYLTVASTIVVVDHGRLFQQMQLIFNDAGKSRAIVDLLSMDMGADHLDLQYTPLIDLGTYFVIAPCVLAASNLVRNVTVANRLRSFVLGPDDPMVSAVIEALIARGFKVGRDVELRAGGKHVELDVVAWRDDVLFLFECKNAYHPCSPHEMRNSFEHIRVARDQLDVRRDLFREPRNQVALFAKLGWAVAPTTDLHTGIVTSNRVFHGATFTGHPVRHAYELINILLRGTLGGEDFDLKVWAGNDFATSDLVAYFAEDSLATKQLSVMEPFPIEIDMGAKKLKFLSYGLDPQRLTDLMVATYRRV